MNNKNYYEGFWRATFMFLGAVIIVLSIMVNIIAPVKVICGLVGWILTVISGGFAEESKGE